MILMMVFAIVGLLIGSYEFKDSRDRGFNTGISFFIGAVVGFFVSLVLSQLLAPPNEWVATKVELVSLRNIDSVDGHFFLGCGSIGDTQYYSYYQKVGKGYRPERMEFAKNITIFEDTQAPCIITRSLRMPAHNSFSKLFPWICILGNPNKTEVSKIEIHIPPGTLRRNFVLN